MADHLKDFELMVLLAVLRLDEDNAYGVPIATEIEHTTGRSVALASVYAALERLEDRGWIASRMGESTAQRGGRAKRHFRVTTRGVRRVREAKGALVKMWSGIRELHRGTT
jgi:DNA-binding PadR family transcriptional regulator